MLALSFSYFQSLMQAHELENIPQVLHQWRSDAFEFLRQDAPKILVILVVYLVLGWLLRIFTHRLKVLSQRQLLSVARAQQLRTLSGVINGFGIFVILFSALIQILGVVNIDVKPLIASAGVVGLAIGFGAQTLVKDVLNGFFILLEDQYNVGDTIKIAGVQGTVENMTLRRTVLRDTDGTLHTVPNSSIQIVSNTTRDWTQVSLHITVAYTENSDKVISVLKELVHEAWNDASLNGMMVAEPEVPGIEHVSATEVDYLMLIKTRPGSQFQITRELRRRIKDCFQKNNIQPGGPGRVYVMENVASTN